MLAPTNRSSGGGVLPIAGAAQPADDPVDTTLANRALVNKPTIAPVGAPVAPPTLPVAQPSIDQPTSPVAAPFIPMPPQGDDTDHTSNPYQGGGNGPTSAAPEGPAVPTPYQTNDPLAFVPPVSTTDPLPPVNQPQPGLSPLTPEVPTGFYNDPAAGGSTVAPGTTDLGTSGIVTETSPGLVTPTPAPVMDVPDPITAPVPSNPLNPTAGDPNVTSAPAPTASSNGSVNLNPTTPSNSLTNYTITPGALADRFGIAKDKIADWNAIEEPIFNRNLQTIAQSRAGAGQLGSGQLRGANRDALTDYNTRRLTTERGFLDDALGGSIDDVYKNVGIAQQQQQFQNGQQQQGFANNVTLQQLQDSEAGQQWSRLMQSLGFNAQQMQSAFDNAYKAQQLSDDETGQAFNQALQQAIFGAQGSPEAFLEQLAKQYATQGFTGTTA